MHIASPTSWRDGGGYRKAFPTATAGRAPPKTCLTSAVFCAIVCTNREDVKPVTGTSTSSQLAPKRAAGGESAAWQGRGNGPARANRAPLFVQAALGETEADRYSS